MLEYLLKNVDEDVRDKDMDDSSDYMDKITDALMFIEEKLGEIKKPRQKLWAINKASREGYQEKALFQMDQKMQSLVKTQKGESESNC